MLNQVNAGGVLPVVVPDSGEMYMFSGLPISLMALQPEAGAPDQPYPPPR